MPQWFGVCMVVFLQGSIKWCSRSELMNTQKYAQQHDTAANKYLVRMNSTYNIICWKVLSVIISSPVKIENGLFVRILWAQLKTKRSTQKHFRRNLFVMIFCDIFILLSGGLLANVTENHNNGNGHNCSRFESGRQAQNVLLET